MLDTHSDYALNKIDKEAIVCPCAGGDHIRLTRNDFASDEEFNYWKAWSDDDYRKIELGGRKDDDCLSFEAQLDTPIPSTDTIFELKLAIIGEMRYNADGVIKRWLQDTYLQRNKTKN